MAALNAVLCIVFMSNMVVLSAVYAFCCALCIGAWFSECVNNPLVEAQKKLIEVQDRHVSEWVSFVKESYEKDDADWWKN